MGHTEKIVVEKVTSPEGTFINYDGHPWVDANKYNEDARKWRDKEWGYTSEISRLKKIISGGQEAVDEALSECISLDSGLNTGKYKRYEVRILNMLWEMGEEKQLQNYNYICRQEMSGYMHEGKPLTIDGIVLGRQSLPVLAILLHPEIVGEMDTIMKIRDVVRDEYRGICEHNNIQERTD